MTLPKGLKLSLVFPSYRKNEDYLFLKEAKEHLGIIPPLSLAYVAAVLEKAGCIVELIDASAFNLTKDQVVDRINKFSPDFLGFTSSTLDFHHTLEWITYLKEKTSLPVIIGGMHMYVYPWETMMHRVIDYGIIGEAEEVLPRFLECLISKRDLSGVRGVCYRKGDHIFITQRSSPVADLDGVPFPARHLLDNTRYYSLISKRKNFTAMITSRGCPFKCIFCDNQTILYRCRNPKNIVDEMEECRKKFNINEIDIFDALFSIDGNRVIEICREMKRRRFEISWSFRTRVDLVNEKMLQELKESGCMRIYYGIESADPAILKNINKKLDIETVKRAVGLTKKKGIDAFGYFMFGNIGETEETIRKTRDLMLQLPLDYVQISPVFTPPNTGLYEMLKKKTNRDYWRDYTLAAAKPDLMPRYGTELTDQQIKRHARECYLKFYLRPGYIARALFKMRSWDELARSVKAIKDIAVSCWLHRLH